MMTRRKRVLLIITFCMFFTYIIYFTNHHNKINLMAIGDGIASGETAFLIDGISYNDYLKSYFISQKILNNYNNSYAYKNYKINDLVNDIKVNKLKDNDKLYINQLINQADLITIGIGEEELIKLVMTNDLDISYIKKTIQEYDNLLYLIKENTEANIVLVGFYENKYLDKSKVIILNSELSNLANKYKVIFININDLLLNQELFSNNNSYYFNYKGHEQIAEMIIHSI